MAYVSKRLNVLSAEIKEETTYGTPVTPAAATDAFYLQPDSTDIAELVVEEFDFDGDLGPNAVGMTPNRRVAPSGRSGRVSLMSYFRGAGEAYAADKLPKNALHAALKACGLTATLDSTASSEKYTYSLQGPAVTPTSLTGYFWAKQLLGESKMERVAMSAMLGNLKIDAPNQRPPRFTFDFVGVYDSIGDETFTAPTLDATLPALASAATIEIGSFTTADVYEWSLDLGRDLSSARVPQNASGGHKGFVAGQYNPTLTVLIEQTKFADFNPYTIRGGATQALEIAVGSTQYNRFTLAAPYGQLMTISQETRGKIPLWRLVFLCTSSTPAGTNALTLVAD